MQDTLVAPTPEVQENHRPGEKTITHDQVVGNFFDVQVDRKEPEQPKAEEKPVGEVPATPAAEPVKEEAKPEPTPSHWYKDIGWESEEAAKNEIVELKKLKEQKPQEIKFANDVSKQVHELLVEGKVDEVIDIYSKQKQLEKVINSEVNADTAESIIKLQMKMKHPKLTDAQIDFQFNEDYGVGKKPTMKESELEEEYNERLQEWNDKVARVNMKKEIAATMAIPELQKLKSEIVFPNISQSQTQSKQPTQEELAAAKKYEEMYYQSVDASIKDFGGFSVKVKNEDVGLPETTISYGVVDAEKSSLGQLMKDFAKENYDANALFAQRWVNEGGALNTKQMIEDKYLLDNRDKIFQKIAEDTATKVWEAYVKGKKNINVNETIQGKVTELPNPVGGQDGLDTIRDNIFGKTG